MTDLLFALPHYLICDVLGNWVGLKSIVRLDSVYVSKCSRETFLDTLKSQELVVTDHDLYTDDFPDELVVWSVKRRIRFSVFAFGFQTCTAVSPAITQEFFKLNGHTLKSFVMHSDNSLDDSAWLKGLAEDCLTLEILEVEKNDVDKDNFGSLMGTVLVKHSKTLQKLDISCGYLHMKLPLDCVFPVLREFHPRLFARCDGLVEFLSQCPSLQRVTISTAISDDGNLTFLNILSACCPLLNSINLLDLSPRVIPEMIRLCPRGPALHLHFDPYMEPRDIISIVTTLPNIQSITLAVSKVTHLVLQKVKEHCANSLRKLSLQDCLPFKHSALLELVKECKNLNILYLHGCCRFTSLQLCQIIRSCLELTSLTLLRHSVDDTVLKTIAESLPKLTSLNVEGNESNSFNNYTLKGLYTVTKGCPKLTKFCMGSHYDVLKVDKARAQIKLQYPNLHIFGPEVSGDWFMDSSDEIM